MKVLEAVHNHCVAFIQTQNLNTASWLVKIRAHTCAYQNAVTKPRSERPLCIYYVRSSKKRRQNDYAKVYIDFLICSSKQYEITLKEATTASFCTHKFQHLHTILRFDIVSIVQLKVSESICRNSVPPYLILLHTLMSLKYRKAWDSSIFMTKGCKVIVGWIMGRTSETASMWCA